MCGIVGYTGKKKALPILLAGLHTLEYRGYDSAGISLFQMSNCLGVRVRGEFVTFRLQAFSQLNVVLNDPVVNDRNPPTAVAMRMGV